MVFVKLDRRVTKSHADTCTVGTYFTKMFAPGYDMPIQIKNRSLFEVRNLFKSVFITNSKNKVWNVMSNNGGKSCISAGKARVGLQ